MDGIHSMVSREKMSAGARKWRDYYEMVPGAPIYRREFGYYCLDRWFEEGLPADTDFNEFFGYDQGGIHTLGQLGWCEGAFQPVFEEKVLEDRGDYELVQDFAGRGVLYFKSRRSGFMPEYVTHPVADMESWQRNCAWRLAVDAPGRFDGEDLRMEEARRAAAAGDVIVQNLVGGYMYLRSLIGPGELLYTFYDQPELIHACMGAWFDLSDAVIARHQRHVSLDVLFIAEDICYKNGPLISPAMMREFLFPYYRQLIDNAKARQLDKARHLYFQVDTDGDPRPVIPVYMELGMDAMVPFEVAAGCDVVEIGRQYPDLRMSGGIDKRILAAGPDAIDREVDRILPVMKARGGYIPTCDHGVPMEVSLESYLHYRKRMREF